MTKDEASEVKALSDLVTQETVALHKAQIAVRDAQQRLERYLANLIVPSAKEAAMNKLQAPGVQR
jgi:phage gp36-like protein